MRFFKTGGPLAPGNHTLRLSGSEHGFRALDTGGRLDGNNNGTSGDDFKQSFNVDAQTGRVVSISDSSTAPGQDVALPPNGSGLHVLVDDGDAIQSATVVVRYDPALITINGVMPGKDVPATADVELTHLSTNRFQLTLASPVGISAGRAKMFELLAEMPASAPYGEFGVMHIESVLLNDGGIAAAIDHAVHASILPGDTNRNQRLDVFDILELVPSLSGIRNRGIRAYPILTRCFSPTLIVTLGSPTRMSAYSCSKSSDRGRLVYCRADRFCGRI